MPRPQPGSGQRRLPQNQRTTQCGSKPSARTQQDKEAHGTPEQPRETRVSRHNTNIPDLHKVGKEQPGVTTRDTEQPCEKQCLTNNHGHLRPPPGRGPTSRTTLHLGHSTRLGNYTPMPPRKAPRNRLPKQQLGVYTRHPERTAKRKPLNTAHKAKKTKPTTLDTSRLQPPCELEQ
ncbi:hypothetical protein Taro_032847 [Colocasia esculenta]|uniref:Uncharacterized protein n=1 Tax=Colocasia esculenta TaxID=4460 RepID=A0A843W550_COLES|nr:hypothetical protein [Colocasia esculenta]